MSDTSLLDQVLIVWKRLLDVDELLADDNVFARGASSLQILSFIEEIDRQFSHRFSIDHIYRHPTPRQLVSDITNDASATEGIPTVLVTQDEVSLEATSAAQQLFYADWKRNPKDHAIYLSVAFRLGGKFDLSTFQHSLNVVVDRHEALRSSFALDAETLVRCFVSDATVPVRVYSMSEKEASELKRTALSIVARVIDETIDPITWPNFRVEVHRYDDDLNLLVIVAHHIILDGPGFRNWLYELSCTYSSALHGSCPALDPSAVQQSAYTTWQNRMLSGNGSARLRAEFAEAMRGAQFKIPLPLLNTAPVTCGAMKGFVKFAVPNETHNALAAIAVGESIGMFSALVTVWNAVIFKMCGVTDVVIRAAGTARDRMDFSKIVGMLWTPIFIRTRFNPTMTFNALMATTHQAVLQALTFQHLPMQFACTSLAPEIDLQREPPNFHFTLHQEDPEEAFTLDNVTVQPLPSKRIDSGADIKVHLHYRDSELSGYVLYDTDRIADETAGRLVAGFLRAIENISENPRLPLNGSAHVA